MDVNKELKIILKNNLENFSNLSKHTTFGIGGKVKYYVQPNSLYELNSVIELAKSHRIKYKVIGNGSNILFSDNGFNGIIICTKNIKDIFLKINSVRAMAGANLSSLVEFCYTHGLGGVEELVSIPATVGGAICMNAGAFNKNISDYVIQVETIYNGKIFRYSKYDCLFKYRKSRFLHSKEIVVAVDFDFPKIDKLEFENKVKNFSKIRKESQPQGKSLGCIFKNPPNISAGKLIESVGLKGYKIGGAEVSNVHGNFIINVKNATASDVVKLINEIKIQVKNKTGISLSEEIEYVGKFTK